MKRLNTEVVKICANTINSTVSNQAVPVIRQRTENVKVQFP